MKKDERLQKLKEYESLKKFWNLYFFKPYAKQIEFLCSNYRETMFMAGNQLGKTIAAAYLVTVHMTGLYPDWWTGRKFEKSTRGWVGGITAESTRDNPQRLLLGTAELGTGMLPKEMISGRSMARGTPDAVESVKVKHVSGGTSELTFKAYKDGREKWQGETLDWIWFDEEPPMDIYMEGLTRTNATDGVTFLTETPLLGISEVVFRFMNPPEGSSIKVVNMTIDHVDHYTPEKKAQIIASYPPHEREARAKGLPFLGSGKVFPISEESIKYKHFQIPDHFRRLSGIDIGWNHPTAVVWGAHDTDQDVIYIYDCYKQKEQTPVVHAAAIRGKGSWIPCAWPHDALQHDKGSGKQIMQLYRDQGVKMLSEHSQYPGDRGSGLEDSIMDIMQRFQTGKLKIAEHLHEWWDEFRSFHRKDGKVVKERDDLMAATRYLVMMIRYAVPKEYYEEKSIRYQKHRHKGSTWMSA